MNHPQLIILWIPRGDEHALAASRGMCEKDPDLLQDLVDTTRRDLAQRMPGVPVRVYRWHVWRVVRALHQMGQLNTPEGRALAYQVLAHEAGGGDDGN